MELIITSIILVISLLVYIFKQRKQMKVRNKQIKTSLQRSIRETQNILIHRYNKNNKWKLVTDAEQRKLQIKQMVEQFEVTER